MMMMTMMTDDDQTYVSLRLVACLLIMHMQRVIWFNTLHCVYGEKSMTIAITVLRCGNDRIEW